MAALLLQLMGVLDEPAPTTDDEWVRKFRNDAVLWRRALYQPQLASRSELDMLRVVRAVDSCNFLDAYERITEYSQWPFAVRLLPYRVRNQPLMTVMIHYDAGADEEIVSQGIESIRRLQARDDTEGYILPLLAVYVCEQPRLNVVEVSPIYPTMFDFFVNLKRQLAGRDNAQQTLDETAQRFAKRLTTVLTWLYNEARVYQEALDVYTVFVDPVTNLPVVGEFYTAEPVEEDATARSGPSLLPAIAEMVEEFRAQGYDDIANAFITTEEFGVIQRIQNLLFGPQDDNEDDGFFQLEEDDDFFQLDIGDSLSQIIAEQGDNNRLAPSAAKQFLLRNQRRKKVAMKTAL